MIKLQYRTKESGLPVLSKTEIDILAEALVYDYSPDCMKEPQPIDVDMFCESYLGLNQDFVYLSNCGVYLGMMVFEDTDKVVIYNPEKDRAENMNVKKNTVLIDNSLVDTSIDHQVEAIRKNSLIHPRDKRMKVDQLLQKKKAQEHRYRFTMGHETAGHAILHKTYFDRLSKESQAPVIQCRKSTNCLSHKDVRSYTDSDWMELQADFMAGSFLMPASMVKEALRRIEDKLDAMWSTYRHYFMVMHISQVFNVSIDAACIRLKHLGYIPETHLQK